MKKRGLGRNIDLLISRKSVVTKPQVEAAPKNSQVEEKNETLRTLPVELLQRGRYQPRRNFSPEKLQELADSIRTQGIIQPIVVRNTQKDQYEILAGERRWRAAQLAGLTEVPVIIKNIPDEAALAIALIENIQRENLNPIEEAIALQRLLDEFSMTHQQVAESVGKSRTTITNLLRLLTLHADVKLMLEIGELEMGHGRALLSLEGHLQVPAAIVVCRQHLSVRATEQLVNSMQNRTKSKAKVTVDPNIQKLQQKLSDQLGAMVRFEHTNKGNGKLVIHYNTLDELDGILEKIQ